jgi:type IV fimbrial biogenesis protein FimT
MRRRTCGYSLYELLLTTSLIAVLLAVGIPSFSSMAARARQRVEIDALFHAIHVARKESIMRRKVVSICPSSDGQSCAPGMNWSSGWLMFENSDRDSPPQIDAGEPLLQQHTVASNVIIQANRRAFTLRAIFLRATNGTFVICDSQDRIPAKGLVVSYTGRPRVAFTKTSGEPYQCTD